MKEVKQNHILPITITHCGGFIAIRQLKERDSEEWDEIHIEPEMLPEILAALQSPNH